MKKALIVNHDEDFLELLKKWLEKKVSDVKCTNKPDDVIPTIEEFKPDFVIIDVLQLEVAKKIKEVSTVPIILMTGNTYFAQSEYLEIADEIIPKPFDVNILDKKLERFLKQTG